jgi:hypothetical protein
MVDKQCDANIIDKKIEEESKNIEFALTELQIENETLREEIRLKDASLIK